MSPLGCSSPVQPRRRQDAGLSRYSFLRPCPRTRLLGHSSPGVRLPSTVCPEAPRSRLPSQGKASKATLLGFAAPTAHTGNKSPRLVRLPRLPGSTRRAPRPFPDPCKHGPVVGPGIRRRFPTRQLRSRSQAFPTSQRLSSSRLRPTIFRWVALMGLRPPGDCTFHEAPTARHRRPTLLTLFPAGALPLS